MIAPLPVARQSVTRRSGVALAATLAAGLVGSPVQAEEAAPAAAPWKLSVTPYAWATSLHGKAGVPFGQLEARPRISLENQEALLRANRARYAKVRPAAGLGQPELL